MRPEIAGDRKRQKDILIAGMLGTTPQAVHNIKQHFLDRTAESDPADGIKRKKRETPPVPAKCTGDVEAKIATIACSIPPEDRGKWTLRLILDLEILPSISYAQVGRILKKNRYKPHLRKMWCIPPEQSASFVAYMEDVLEVYSRARNPRYPLVFMDEQPIDLRYDSSETIHLSENDHTEKVEHEYFRNSTCRIFCR